MSNAGYKMESFYTENKTKTQTQLQQPQTPDLLYRRARTYSQEELPLDLSMRSRTASVADVNVGSAIESWIVDCYHSAGSVSNTRNNTK
jgi:hypothetical protein